MTYDDRCERTVRLLTQRLDELAGALTRSGAPVESVAPLIELASVATMHAVALELLSQERAAEIWTSAVRRHPVLRRIDGIPADAPGRLAA